MRTILKWLLAAGIGLLAAAGCQQAPEKGLSRKEAAIRKIDKVKSERQLGLVEYEVRNVVKAQESKGFFLLKSKRAILCSCKAYLKAGIDLTGFNPMTDIAIDPEETMVSITLPSPTLLSLNMPIDSVEVLYEKKKLSSGFNLTDLNELLRQGEDQVRNSVQELGILEDARRNARLFFEPLFKQLGFTSVQVLFKDDENKE